VTRLDILAFGAHPDDIELAVGGTLALMKARGYAVGACDATRGELGTRGTAEKRAVECAEASKILGLDVRVNLGLPDGSVFDGPESRAAAIDVIRKYRPTVVLAPRADDLHPDHARLSTIVTEAAFLAGVSKHTPGLPPHRPRAVWEYASHTTFDPTFVVDVASVFETKRAAALAYKSQFHDPSSTEPATYISRPEFWAWWEGRARHYGNMIGAAYGEAFFVKGPMRLDDPVAVFKDSGYYPK